jgi:hypothetical protein
VFTGNPIVRETGEVISGEEDWAGLEHEARQKTTVLAKLQLSQNLVDKNLSTKPTIVRLGTHSYSCR